VFPWTAETNPEARKAWAGTLDKLVALSPQLVVPGHQKPDQHQDPANPGGTPQMGTVLDTLANGLGGPRFEGRR
jgi:hypothetical protein